MDGIASATVPLIESGIAARAVPMTVDGVAAAGVHELIEAQARRRPDAVAVTGEGGSLTYAALNARANRLARHLVRLGVGPERRVGIAVERSADMVVGLLAILKAGGAYLPLDPAYPAARLAYLVKDAGVDVVVAHAAVADRLPDTGAIRVALDGDGASVWTAEPAADLRADERRCVMTRDTLAYVMYTSGSTGQPKGVMVTHANVVRLLAATEAWFGFGPDDVWTCFHSYAFDFSVWELWGALAYGGRVVVVPWETSRTPEAFHALLAREGVTVLNQTPSAFLPLVDADARSAAPLALRLVIFGGEALEPATLARWIGRHGDQAPRLVNMYGITETTVHVTYRPITADDAVRERRSPIGVPIPDLELHVLDRDLLPCPSGVAGELYVGGDGLARGYLGRPALTAERFVAHPFTEEPGARLYRSGDVARALPDGGVEYLGRLDAQVKIRGFRIELGEIEAALARHPDVRAAAVIARDDGPGDTRLVAYVVTGGAELDASTLRRFLAATLPDYMLPAAFVPLDALPLTANGKLDRRALPAPEVARAPVETRYVAPRTPAERTLAAIWAAVLNVPEVGAGDNFFDLGGDSITSLQIVARAAEAGLTLAPRDVFLHQTVERLALAARGAPAPRADQDVVTGDVPLTAIQRWFLEQQGGAPAQYTQAVLLVAPRTLTAARLTMIVDALLHHHDALRLRLVHENGAWRQSIVSPGGPPPVAMEDLSALAPEHRRAELEARARAAPASLDLAHGPIVRAVLFDLGPEEPPRLLLVVHHLAIDVVSWRILLEDLARAWEQLERAEPIILPPRTTSVKTWAEHVVALAQGDALRDELVSWQDALPVECAPLPRDHPDDGAPRTIAGAEALTRSLDAEKTTAVLRETRRAYRVTVEEVLLAALALGFRPWTGAEVLRVDVETHGRDAALPGTDLSRTVGWFTAIVPLAVRAAADPGATLVAVKEQVRRLPRRGAGHGLLRYLAPAPVREALLGHAPAEVSLNYVGQVDEVADGLFRAASESVGPTQGPDVRRPYAIDVIASIAGGRLRLDWVYDRAAHARDTIERLAASVTAALAEIAAACSAPGAERYTPSDFSSATLAQAELDALARHAAAVDGGGPNLEAIYPLSPAQQGMLYESLAAPGTGRHVEQGTFVIEGPLDLGAFDRAWQRVVARHGVLRTRFVWADRDEPLQVVLARVRLPIALQDWRGVPAHEDAERCAAYLAEDRRRGFDLAEAPLVRVSVMRLGETRHRVAWTFHHILMDGWCLPLVMRDFLALYRAELTGVPAALPAVRPFADYVRWLREQDVTRAEAYWRGALGGARGGTPPGRIVDGDELRLSAGAERYGEVPAALAPATAAALAEHAARARLTPGALMQGAWALLLGRYTGAEEVVFGVTVSGRPATLPGAEAMVGPFLTTVPLAVRIGDGATAFWPWLATVQAAQLERGAYEFCSAGQIHAWTGAAGASALYESVLVFENYPVRSVLGDGASGMPFTVQAPEASGARTASAVTLIASAGTTIELRLVHDRDRVSARDAAAIVRHLVALLEGIAADPAPALATLTAGVDDEDIPRVRASARAARGDHVPPRTPDELRLATLWEALLGVQPVGVRDDFFALGGHSLLVVRLVKAIEAEFGRRLPLDVIFAGATIERLAERLREARDGAPWSPLVTIQPGGTRPPLFFVHPLGGNVVCYAELARRLARDRPVYGLVARGFEPGQAPHVTLRAMAAEYVAAVRRVQPHGPYRLAGWSFGGFVAVEMASQLRADGEAVALLGLLDTPHPSAVPAELRRTDTAGLLASVFGPALPLSVDALRALDRDAQLDHVLERVRETGVVPVNTTAEEMRRWFEVCWTNHVMEVPLETVEGPVVLVRAREEARRLSDDPALGWAGVVRGSLDVRWVDGAHETMLEARHVGRLAEMLEAVLHGADATPPDACASRGAGAPDTVASSDAPAFPDTIASPARRSP
jgi:amino acid adenylation domain-containing protein/non-ribosomal peptide synthase protein (TIGR01720 family)